MASSRVVHFLVFVAFLRIMRQIPMVDEGEHVKTKEIGCIETNATADSPSQVGKTIHFITYGNDRFAKSKQRIVQEAIGTGWFATAKAYKPKDLPDSFLEQNQYAEILALPRGGGYWLWKFCD